MSTDSSKFDHLRRQLDRKSTHSGNLTHAVLDAADVARGHLMMMTLLMLHGNAKGQLGRLDLSEELGKHAVSATKVVAILDPEWGQTLAKSTTMAMTGGEDAWVRDLWIDEIAELDKLTSTIRYQLQRNDQPHSKIIARLHTHTLRAVAIIGSGNLRDPKDYMLVYKALTGALMYNSTTYRDMSAWQDMERAGNYNIATLYHERFNKFHKALEAMIRAYGAAMEEQEQARAAQQSPPV